MKNNKSITIKDIAKLTGFSAQTVSRVINNDPKVKANTKDLILKVVNEMGYKPNLYAKSLVGKRNKNIVILLKRKIGHKATIWTNTLVNEIILSNKDKNTSIFVEQYYNDEDLDKSILNTTSMFIDGAIIFYEEKDDKRISLLKKSNIPFVIFGKGYDNDNIYVGNDDFNSSFKATEYLFSKKLENIVFVSADPTPMNEERVRGVQEAYIKNNKNIDNLKIIRKVNTSDDIRNAIYQFKDNLPQCFFINGDEKAIIAIKTLHDLGIKVPDQVKIMGFDDLAISKYIIPSLTTISLDYKKLSEKLLFKLFRIIDNKTEISEEISSRLAIRESTN